MPHINELIDFTVVALIVYDGKVLLVHHKGLGKWLPVGGHIELDEDPEQALFREIEEESGLEVNIIATRPNLKTTEARKYLFPPTYLDIHQINENHRHIGMVYFGKAKSDKVKLAEREHNEIKWFSKDDLDKPEFNLQEDVKFYAKDALKRVT